MLFYFRIAIKQLKPNNTASYLNRSRISLSLSVGAVNFQVMCHNPGLIRLPGASLTSDDSRVGDAGVIVTDEYANCRRARLSLDLSSWNSPNESLAGPDGPSRTGL